MYFYRPLGRIEAITFDLDDTLYDNYEVIRRTEQESLRFLQNYHPGLRAFTSEGLRQLRQECWRKSRRFITTSRTGAGVPYIWR